MKPNWYTKSVGAVSLLAALSCLPSFSATVQTLGGGPTPGNLARTGYRDGDTLQQAKFNQPVSVAVETNGTLVIADRKNRRLREVDFPGDEASETSTLASRLNFPVGVVVDGANHIYVATERDHTVSVYDDTGVRLTGFAVSGKPTAIAIDSHTNIYVAEAGGTIEQIAPDGSLTVVADGFVNPTGVAVMNDDTLAVSSAGTHAIYLVDLLTSGVTTLAGGNGPGFLDGPANLARFNKPSGIAMAPSGALVVADRLNHRVRLVNTNGTVSTLYGVDRKLWQRPFPGWRDGSAVTAQAREPVAVTVAGDGTVYVLEAFWNTLRQVAATGLGIPSPGTNPPSITAQPQSIAANIGDTVTLSAAVAGTPPLTFQWLFNGVTLSGATNSNLILTNLQPAQGGNYSLLVSNPFGFTISSNAFVGVASPPVITGQPMATNIAAGGTVVLTATAVGTAPFTFTWFLNGTNVPGATGPTLTLTNIQSGQGGIYTVVVSNALGTVTSSNTLVAVVSPPTFAPVSGFYPMGVTVTVTSTVPVYYTTDGSEPTTNSRQVTLVNNVGTLFFFDPVRDITFLRLKAISGDVGSATVGGVSSPVNEIGISRDIKASVGSTLVVPVVVNLSGSNELRSVQFIVEVVPQNGAPPIPWREFRALSMTSNDFVQVAGPAAPNTVATYIATPYTNGPTNLLVVTALGTDANYLIKRFAVAAMVKIPIDPGASEGQTYTISIRNPSATSDAKQSLLPIAAMPSRTITVTNTPYLVGDTSPGRWYNAGEFGDGDLQNDDVNNVFYASHGVRTPLPFTDAFNAMDAAPVSPSESGEYAGPVGDGFIDNADLSLILDRALRRDPQNYIRRHVGEETWISTATFLPAPIPAAQLKSTPVEVGPGTLWLKQVTLSAGRLGNTQPGGTYSIPVWLHAAPGCAVGGLNMRLAVMPDNGAPAVGTVSFTPVIGTQNYMGGNAVAPNEALCSWLLLPSPAFAPGLVGSNLLGYITFTVPPTATEGQTYSVRFVKMSGGRDMNTPYQFEGIPGSASVQAAARPAERTSDEWRAHYFAVGDPDADMLADPDGDGVPNWQEYIDGTDPTSAASFLHLDQAAVTTDSGPAIQLSWLSASLKLYTVERAAGASGPWTSVAQNIAGDGFPKQVTDNAPSSAAPVYRVRVQP